MADNGCVGTALQAGFHDLILACGAINNGAAISFFVFS